MSLKKSPAYEVLILLVFLLLNVPGIVFSQSNNEMIDKLALPLYKASQSSSREQVYIQLSKGSFEAGEDLWFKAFVLNALTFSLSLSSKTLYVRVVKEDDGVVVWRERYEIRGGGVNGHAYLPSSLKEGSYRLEAFNMASFFREETAFKAFRRFRVVQDYKALQNEGLPEKASLGKVQFGAFPEGGKLISGVAGKLAFKAVDTAGLPVEVQGMLLENGKGIQEVRSVHAGMGSLLFTPISGRNYILQLKVGSQDTSITLPQADSNGISLRLSSRDTSNLEFVITRSQGSSPGKVYLRGQLRGKTCFLAAVPLEKEMKVKVPMKNFAQQGVAEFTVFNQEFIPAAERLVYVHLQRKLYVQAQLSKKNFIQREKVVLNIKTSDEKGNPVPAELSISVSDKLYQNLSDPVNILTYNFLSTQLKGRIYNPQFYFDERNKNREEALDLLLLTQGWRKYVWNEENLKAEGPKQAVIFDETFGTAIFTKRVKEIQPGPLVNFYLSDEGGRPKNSLTIAPGPGGKFAVNTGHLRMGQGANIYLKPQGADGLRPKITLWDPFMIIDTLTRRKDYSSLVSILSDKGKLGTSLYATMESRLVRLKEVQIGGKTTKGVRDKYLGRLDSLAKIDPNGAFVCKHGLLNGYWQGYFCARGRGQCRDTLTTSPIEGRSYAIARYELNGATNVWVLKETLNTEYHNPNHGLSEEELLRRNNITRLSGYYPEKEFYQPDYDKDPNGIGLPDARNLLLWAPAINTNETGEATLKFFCSDINSNFVVQIEGLTKSGLLGCAQFDFLVVKK